MSPNDHDPPRWADDPPDAAATPSDQDSAADSPTPPTAEELLRQQALAALTEQQRKPPGIGGAWLLLATMALFALSFAGSFDKPDGIDVTGLALLVGIIFFHEVGHWSAMKLFGYQDLRIFFIPFFGAAAAGRKHAAPGWQQGIVILAGPLPGIALAVALAALRDHLPWQPPWLHEATLMLLVINVFNLLPFMPLDGGRLLQITIFIRRPLLETLFQLFAVAGLGLGAWLLGSWVLGIIAAFMLLGTPIQHRKAKQRRALRREEPDLPTDLGSLSETQRQRLFDGARAIFSSLPATTNNLAATLATMMRTLHEEAITRTPGVVASLLLLGMYALGWLAVPIVAVLIGGHDPRPDLEEALALMVAYGNAQTSLDEGNKALAQAAAEPDRAEELRAEAAESFRLAELVARKALEKRRRHAFVRDDEDLKQPLDLLAQLRQVEQAASEALQRLTAKRP